MLAVRYLGKKPAYIVEAYLPRTIGDLIARQDLDKATPVELYETRLDMPPQRVVEEISVSAGNAICAGPLGIRIGAPVVLHTLKFHGPDGPLQYVREWWHPNISSDATSSTEDEGAKSIFAYGYRAAPMTFSPSTR